MAGVQVAEFGDVARDVVVEVGAGERCLAVVVIGAEGEGQRAAATCFVFEGGDESAADAAKTVVPPDDERVQFPDAPVVLREGGWNVNLTLHEVDCREDRRL